MAYLGKIHNGNGETIPLSLGGDCSDKKIVVKERFPPYRGQEWERKAIDSDHPNFWKNGVANLLFLDFIGGKRVILDVGCGTGGFTPFLIEKCDIDLMVGIDVVRDMIEVARDKLVGTELEYRTGFIVGDGRLLPFRDSSFEALVSRGDVLPWLIPQDEALKEFQRVMKTGAIIVMEMDNGALIEADTTNCYFERGQDGEVVCVVNRVNVNRNCFNLHYILDSNSNITKIISQSRKFIETGWLSAEGYSIESIEKETVEIREEPITRWFTSNELKNGHCWISRVLYSCFCVFLTIMTT